MKCQFKTSPQRYHHPILIQTLTTQIKVIVKSDLIKTA